MTPPRNPDGEQATEERVLVCLSCRRPLVFGADGWEHHEPDSCTEPVAAWPESIEDEADDADAI